MPRRFSTSFACAYATCSGIELKKQQLESLEASVKSAASLFQNARVEYVEVLLALRDLIEARTVLIEFKRQQLTAVATAYQALGGGVPPAYATIEPPQYTNHELQPLQSLWRWPLAHGHR